MINIENCLICGSKLIYEKEYNQYYSYGCFSDTHTFSFYLDYDKFYYFKLSLKLGYFYRMSLSDDEWQISYSLNFKKYKLNNYNDLPLEKFISNLIFI